MLQHVDATTYEAVEIECDAQTDTLKEKQSSPPSRTFNVPLVPSPLARSCEVDLDKTLGEERKGQARGDAQSAISSQERKRDNACNT